MGFGLQKIRERVNIALFDSKDNVLQFMRIISLLLVSVVLAGVVYFYGFQKTPESIRINTILVRSSLIYFLVRYLIMLFYDFHPRKFIRERWLEGIILFLFLLMLSILYSLRICW